MIYNDFVDFIKDNIIWLSILCAVLVLFIIILIVVIVKHHIAHKKPKLKIDEAYVAELIKMLGEKSNIENIDVDGNKLKVTVLDLNKCDLEGIKTKAQSGVFVTGNNIKTLFMYDSSILRKELNKYKG